MEERRYSDLEIYRRLLAQARPYWWHIFAIFLISLLAAPLALLPPLPLKLAVDSVLGKEPLPGFIAFVIPGWIEQSSISLLFVIIGLVVLFEVAAYLQYLILWLLKTWTGERLVLEFRSVLFRRAQALSTKYHVASGTADTIYKIENDASCIRAIAMEGIAPFVTSVVSLIAMVIVTAMIDWQISVVAMAIIPVLMYLTLHSSRRLRKKWGDIKRLESRTMSMVWEVLSSLRLVKAFGREDSEQKRYEAQASEVVNEHFRAAWIESVFDFLIGLTLAIGTAAALYLGVMHVQSGTMTLGDLILVMAYLICLYEPLEHFMEKVTALQSALASADRAFCLLDEIPDVPSSPDAVRVDRAKGNLEFRNVSFAYEGGRAALSDINLTIAAGQRVGVVGPTGAGKSTLASLLVRFYDPTSGGNSA